MQHSRFVAPWSLLLTLALLLAGVVTAARGLSAQPFFWQLSQPAASLSAGAFPRALAAHLGASWARGSADYSGYRQIVDNHNIISVRIPTEWNDFDTSTWTHQGRQIGVFTAASTSLDAFFSKSPASGMFIGVSRTLAEQYDPDAVLDLERQDLAGQCTPGDRTDYADPFYIGRSELYTSCAEDGHNLLMVAAAPASRAFMVVVRVVMQQPADLEAATQIFETVQVVGQIKDGWGSPAAANQATGAGAELSNLYYCPLQ